MAEKVYRIKPLVWEGRPRDKFGDEYYRASVPFGSFSVQHTPERGWRWEYCFDEYYDEDSNECDGLEDGKALAQSHWESRIKQALEEVEQ